MVISCYLILLPKFTATTSASNSAASAPPYDTPSAADRAPSRSNTSCSHHLLETHVPGYRTASPQRSRIDRGKIYCTTLLCLLMIYS